jgi:hypothetical protein
MVPSIFILMLQSILNYLSKYDSNLKQNRLRH